ncbi:uncharacterized protein BCR38DRAFT_46346 [Pseudomassariella vexata]|uniref:Uncharacterized protein n=1 Tax=Pseudomassariella vexata TaxID=1141098 RepID=A0A1Y2DNB9_9PEZI|nr:uncharacterized protein BCR38DRAFT_46346 [Pseudomassariella vexata]ORY60772.1 hypothetical protein BCR38DRAFT_46346 [Pseudomassariella vexata]
MPNGLPSSMAETERSVDIRWLRIHVFPVKLIRSRIRLKGNTSFQKLRVHLLNILGKTDPSFAIRGLDQARNLSRSSHRHSPNHLRMFGEQAACVCDINVKHYHFTLLASQYWKVCPCWCASRTLAWRRGATLGCDWFANQPRHENVPGSCNLPSRLLSSQPRIRVGKTGRALSLLLVQRGCCLLFRSNFRRCHHHHHHNH